MFVLRDVTNAIELMVEDRVVWAQGAQSNNAIAAKLNLRPDPFDLSFEQQRRLLHP